MKLDTVSPPAAGSNVASVAALHWTPDSRVAAQAQAPALPAQAVAPTRSGAESIHEVARQINAFLKSSSAGVEFAVDGQTDRVIVRVVDAETKQVIRQMPSEEMLAISLSLDRISGLLLEQKA